MLKPDISENETMRPRRTLVDINECFQLDCSSGINDRALSNGCEKSQFPPLKCSKYTWIGHPSMEKRRR